MLGIKLEAPEDKARTSVLSLGHLEFNGSDRGGGGGLGAGEALRLVCESFWLDQPDEHLTPQGGAVGLAWAGASFVV